MVKICAKIEGEISQLPKDEQAEFLAEVGLKMSGLEQLIKLSFRLLGLITYLILNFNNRVFLGDSGSIILSYVISYFFIKSYNYEMSFYADQIFLIMLIPGIDLFRVAILRILSGKNPLKADRMHLHHLLAHFFSFEKTIIIILLLISTPIILNIFLNLTLPLIIISLVTYLILIFYVSKKLGSN